MKIIEIFGGYKVQVDDEDYERVSSFGVWRILINHKKNTTKYVRANFKRCSYKEAKERGIRQYGQVLMHRFILGVTEKGIIVDHKDGNGLNNQKENLRIATQQENIRNSNRRINREFKGISKNWNRWQALIKLDGKNVIVGSHPEKVIAAALYDEAARKHYGEFARCNFEPIRFIQ